MIHIFPYTQVLQIPYVIDHRIEYRRNMKPSQVSFFQFNCFGAYSSQEWTNPSLLRNISMLLTHLSFTNTLKLHTDIALWLNCMTQENLLIFSCPSFSAFFPLRLINLICFLLAAHPVTFVVASFSYFLFWCYRVIILDIILFLFVLNKTLCIIIISI